MTEITSNTTTKVTSIDYSLKDKNTTTSSKQGEVKNRVIARLRRIEGIDGKTITKPKVRARTTIIDKSVARDYLVTNSN